MAESFNLVLSDLKHLLPLRVHTKNKSPLILSNLFLMHPIGLGDRPLVIELFHLLLGLTCGDEPPLI